MYGETLPDLPLTERLISYWAELGLCGRLFDGIPAPLQWGEMDAFVRLNGYDLSEVEASCLMDMSRAYANAMTDTKPLSIAPMERPHD